MLIELRKGITIDPCTFTAIIGPAQVAKDLITTNSDLQRYLFLYVSGNYSRILTHVSRTSTNFDVRRAFSAHQLFTILNEVSHTVIFIEHDPTLFDGAWDMIAPIAGALNQISHESTVILYSSVADRSFSLLTRKCPGCHLFSSGRPGKGRGGIFPEKSRTTRGTDDTGCGDEISKNRSGKLVSGLFDVDRIEFHRFDAFLGHEPFGERLELAPVPVDEDYFEAPLVGHVGVERCLDNRMELVLNIRDIGEEPALLVIVDHRNNALTHSLHIRHPLVIGNVGTDRVAYSFRTGGIPAVVQDFIKPVEQVFGKGYPYPGKVVVHVSSYPLGEYQNCFLFNIVKKSKNS